LPIRSSPHGAVINIHDPPNVQIRYERISAIPSRITLQIPAQAARGLRSSPGQDSDSCPRLVSGLRLADSGCGPRAAWAAGAAGLRQRINVVLDTTLWMRSLICPARPAWCWRATWCRWIPSLRCWRRCWRAGSVSSAPASCSTARSPRGPGWCGGWRSSPASTVAVERRRDRGILRFPTLPRSPGHGVDGAELSGGAATVPGLPHRRSLWAGIGVRAAVRRDACPGAGCVEYRGAPAGLRGPPGPQAADL
jgi:hypothetical protein